MASNETTENNTPAGISWVQADSREGETYTVARTEFELAAKAKVEESEEGEQQLFGTWFGSKKSFDVRVRWEVGQNRQFQVSQDLADSTGITSYTLTESSNKGLPWPQYYLEFNCSKTYNFYFYDESGDSYQCNTWLTGSHSISFNSVRPTIVRITGS